MPWINNGIRDLAGAFATGVARLTSWLFGGGRSRDSAVGELQQRYPDMRPSLIREIADRMERSARLAGEFGDTMQHPDGRRVPRDPSLPAGMSYHYDVTYVVPEHVRPDGTVRPRLERYFPHNSPRPLSYRELADVAYEHLRLQWDHDSDYIRRLLGDLPSIDAMNITFESIWRS